MRFVKGVVIVATIHLVLSVFCLVWLFSGSMARFDTGEAASMPETITQAGTEVLLFPLSEVDGLLSPKAFPGLWGYIPFMLNSLVWGLVVMGLLTGVRSVGMTVGPASHVAMAPLLFIGVFASSLQADDWPAARVNQVFSDNGNYFVRIVPGNNYSETIGFKGAPKGEPARAAFYARQADRSYKLVAEVPLHNPVAPVDALVNNEGYLLTLDNWHNVGYGKIVAIYRPNGDSVVAYELGELYKPEQIDRISVSKSSRWWRCKPFGYVDTDKQSRVYVMEQLGGTFTFELMAGRYQYLPGHATCRL